MAVLTGIVAAVLLWHYASSPTFQQPSVAQIEQEVVRGALAARLLTVTEMLAERPYAQDLVRTQYQYLADKYPETEAAERAKLRIE